MAYTVISSHTGGNLWPSDWGASGTLGIICSRDLMADDGKSFQQGNGQSLTNEFVTTATITVASNIPTYGSFTLPKTDVASPVDVKYTGVIFDANGVWRDWLFSGFDLVTSLGDSITFQAWWVDNQQRQRYPQDSTPSTTEMNLAIAAANASVVPATTTLKGIAKVSANPVDSANPIAVGDNDSRVEVFFHVDKYGAVVNGTTNDKTAIDAAILAAGLSGEGGGQVFFPGICAISATITQPNRVAFKGANVRKGGLKAITPFTGTYLVNAVNGTTSMFDALIEEMYLDGNDVAGVGGVLSDAYQENSGLHRVVINKFRTYGLRYQNGYGGAATSLVSRVELFGSESGATAGIRVDQISLVGGFQLHVENSVIAGGVAIPLPRGIDMVMDSLTADNVHFEHTTSGIYLDGVGHHTLIGVNGSTTVTNLVEIASTFTGTLTMKGCFRNGATNFLKDNRVDGQGTITDDRAQFTLSPAYFTQTYNTVGPINDPYANTLQRTVDDGESIFYRTINGNSTAASANLLIGIDDGTSGAFPETGAGLSTFSNTIGARKNIWLNQFDVGKAIKFGIVNAEVARFAPDTGNLLLNVTTDAGQRLQVSGTMKLGTAGATLTAVIPGTVTINPASINGTTVSSQTFTLTGAVTGDKLILNPPTAGLTTGLLVLQSFVSAADTITVVLYNTTGAPIDEASATWHYTLLR